MKAESTTGDETAKTQKQVVIYLLADEYIEVEVQPLTMGDLCEIVLKSNCGNGQEGGGFCQTDAGDRPAASRDGAECHLCFNVGGSDHSAGPEAICGYPVPVCAAGSGTVDC